MFVAKNIFIITINVKFALNAKKALERDGNATVTVFSSGKAGIDYLRQHPQDVAIIDFRIKDMPGTDMIDHMRTLQPKIAVIAAPDHPAIYGLKERYNIQQIINIPIATRQLLNILENAVEAMVSNQETDTPTTNYKQGLSVERATQAFEFWLEDTDDGDTVVEIRTPTEDVEPPKDISSTFQRLAAEEPPMPKFAEGSTIRDLRASLTNLEDIKRVLVKDEDDDSDNEETLVPETTDTDSIPAAIILETALDESTPIHTFTLEEFMQRVVEQGVEGIAPLPSWEAEEKRYIREPDFLQNDLPFPELDEAIEYTGTVTIVSDAQKVETDVGDMVTDPIEPVQRSHPVEPERQEFEPIEIKPEPEASQATTVDEIEDEEPIVEESESQKIAPPRPTTLPDLKVLDETAGQIPFTQFDEEDPELAQLATTLTQVALELTADATVLARNHEIVAYAGKLPPTDLDELHDQLTIEWDKVKESGKSRILFASLPSTGEEFMVSTRGTEAGFTLSLIFSGTRPLHDIRRQSKRLAEALANLPEPEPEPEPPANKPTVSIPSTDEIGIRKPIAFLWLLRDHNTPFDNATQTKIVKSLDVALTTSGWKVGDIHAPDYVYIYGLMPAKLNARDTLNKLMQRTADIVQQDNDTLWDNSYLILQPGREMSSEEIQRFVNFVRR